MLRADAAAKAEEAADDDDSNCDSLQRRLSSCLGVARPLPPRAENSS